MIRYGLSWDVNSSSTPGCAHYCSLHAIAYHTLRHCDILVRSRSQCVRTHSVISRLRFPAARDLFARHCCCGFCLSSAYIPNTYDLPAIPHSASSYRPVLSPLAHHALKRPICQPSNFPPSNLPTSNPPTSNIPTFQRLTVQPFNHNPRFYTTQLPPSASSYLIASILTPPPTHIQIHLIIHTTMPSTATLALAAFELLAFVGMIVVLFTNLGSGGFNPGSAQPQAA